MAAPTAEKFDWARGALCEFSPACGLFASTLAQAVPVWAGATGLGFGAATAGAAASALSANVANSGPTLATDVQVTITPHLRTQDNERSGLIHRALDDGISAPAPGRTITWNLGVAWEVIGKGETNVYRIRVRATGPFGAVPEIAYSVDLETLRYSLAVPRGTVNGVAVAITKAFKVLGAALTREASD